MTPQEIQALLIEQNYQNYVVTDIGTFPWCVPKTEQGEYAELRYQRWKQKAIPPMQLLQYSEGFTSKTFINHVKRTQKQKEKQSECSNFAYHAIGVLVRKQTIVDHYNICLVGIMQGKHNMVILLPKDVDISKHQNKLKKGQLPPGALIIDPWAVGMGHEPINALAVERSEYTYKDSLKGMVFHYQSKHDQTLNQTTVEQALDTSEPLIEPNGPPRLRRLDSQRLDANDNPLLADEGVNFNNPTPLSSINTNRADLTKFDLYMANLLEKVTKLNTHGYKEAYNEGLKCYSDLQTARDEYIKDGGLQNFKSSVDTTLTKGASGELGRFRGIGYVFKNITNAILLIVTLGNVQLTTNSVTKMNSIKQELSTLKEQEQQQRQPPPPPPRSQ